jgi:hypothetical protein
VVPEPDQLEVFPSGQQLVHRGVLTREADGRADLVRPGDHVEPGHAGVTDIRPQQRAQYPDRRGLGAAVGFRFHSTAGRVAVAMLLILAFGYAFSWMNAAIGISALPPRRCASCSRAGPRPGRLGVAGLVRRDRRSPPGRQDVVEHVGEEVR